MLLGDGSQVLSQERAPDSLVLHAGADMEFGKLRIIRQGGANLLWGAAGGGESARDLLIPPILWLAAETEAHANYPLGRIINIRLLFCCVE